MYRLNFFILLISTLTYGQSRRITGLVIDTALGKKFHRPTVCICDTSTLNHKQIGDCIETGNDGRFDLEVPPGINNNPFALLFMTLARSPKRILIYDTTKIPLKVFLEDPFVEEKKKVDTRKYDTTIKLSKFKHSELKGINKKLGDQKTYKRSFRSV